jgi:hypothetical protein
MAFVRSGRRGRSGRTSLGASTLWRDYTLPDLLPQAGYAEPACRVKEGGRIDQQAVTQALVDITADGPAGLVNGAAIHLPPRNLEPTVLARFGKDSPIDRLAELASTIF